MGGDPSGVAVLHHGVTQPVLNPSVGTRLVMHGKADVSGTVKTGDGLPLIQGRAGDEVGASGHGVRFVVHAVMMAQNRGQWGDWWTVPQLSTGGRKFVLLKDVTVVYTFDAPS